MKKRVILSIASIALAAALIGIGTMAWFTDQVGLDEPEEFGAGTLMVDIEDFDDTTDGIGHDNLMNVQPGDEWEYDLEIRNDGSLDYDYRVMMFWQDETGQDAGAFEGFEERYDGSERDDFGTHPLSEVIEFAFINKADSPDPVYEGTLKDLDEQFEDEADAFFAYADEGFLFEADGDNQEWKIEANMPTGDDLEENGEWLDMNKYQGSELEFRVKVSAKQVDDDAPWALYDHPYGWLFDTGNVIEDVAVDYGTPEAEVLAELPDEVDIRDTNAELQEGVALDWDIDGYDDLESGDYTATASFDPADIDDNYPADFYPAEAATVTVTVGPQPEIDLQLLDVPEHIEENESFELSYTVDPEAADVEVVNYDDDALEKDGWTFTAKEDSAPANAEITVEATKELHKTAEETVSVAIIEELPEPSILPPEKTIEFDMDDPVYPELTFNVNEDLYDYDELEGLWFLVDTTDDPAPPNLNIWGELIEVYPTDLAMLVEPHFVEYDENEGEIRIDPEALATLEAFGTISEAKETGDPIIFEIQFADQPAPAEGEPTFDPDTENWWEHDRFPVRANVVEAE